MFFKDKKNLPHSGAILFQAGDSTAPFKKQNQSFNRKILFAPTVGLNNFCSLKSYQDCLEGAVGIPWSNSGERRHSAAKIAASLRLLVELQNPSFSPKNASFSKASAHHA